MATHVELREEGLRTGVQIPPAPPFQRPRASTKIRWTPFFFVNQGPTVPEGSLTSQDSPGKTEKQPPKIPFPGVLFPGCWRRLNIAPPCRSKFDPGRVADFQASNCVQVGQFSSGGNTSPTPGSLVAKSADFRPASGAAGLISRLMPSSVIKFFGHHGVVHLLLLSR